MYMHALLIAIRLWRVYFILNANEEHMYITGNKFDILLNMTRTPTGILRVHF